MFGFPRVTELASAPLAFPCLLLPSFLSLWHKMGCSEHFNSRTHLSWHSVSILTFGVTGITSLIGSSGS